MFADTGVGTVAHAEKKKISTSKLIPIKIRIAYVSFLKIFFLVFVS